MPAGYDYGVKLTITPAGLSPASTAASFAAPPVGYQTNLLVMGPGHYRFADFARAGVPLVILVWLVFSLFAPWYYGL